MDFRKVKGVVIDAGHGGEDAGAVGNGIIEKNLNLDNSLYMYDRLKELGVPVTLTRDSDETLERSDRIRRMLAPYGNGTDVVIVSNHINAGGGDGAEVIYALRNNDTLARSILEAIGSTGQNTRKYYQRRLPSDPSKDYYYIMRDTPNAETVLIEYGFLDSTGDDVQQLKTDNLDMVEAAVRAIVEYAGYTYIPPAGSNMYAVKAGDSLYKIANQFGVTVNELIAANNLTNNVLQIGQILTIPQQQQEVSPSEYEVYIVKSGDSLYKIANQFGVTVDDIIQLNNLSTTLLQLNQQLLIPKKVTEQSGLYTVQSGDTLYQIALKYGLTVDELKKANNLSTNILQVGQELYIPGLMEEENDEVISDEITYIVQSGDSLWSIAKKYNISVNELKEYNNLTSNMLSIGQKLLIPQTENYETYTVQAGDTIFMGNNK